VLSGDQIVVPDKLIAQACPFVRDEFFHCVVLLGFILLLWLSARIAYGDMLWSSFFVTLCSINIYL
ncbi:MAG: hypothetical protein U0N01_10160, partial [Pseudoruminococcus massiliensis]|uniref:hypothetical protein n=1 Tax=Pseudoruminococcus massiliensis TaxID=2086583 RepID=UPI002F946E5E